MKRLLFVASFIFLLQGCDQIGEGARIKKKKDADLQFSLVKAIPISQPCENLNGYLKLEEIEYKNKTTYYSDITPRKITRYSRLCEEKNEADAVAALKAIQTKRQATIDRRIAEAKGKLHVLGYQPDVQLDKYSCSNYSFNQDRDEYTCILSRSKTDVLVFHSDPFTKSLGKIFRFILIDREQAPKLIDKLHGEFGSSDAMGSNADGQGNLYVETFYGWGNVKLENMGGLYALGPKYDLGRSLRLSFSECADMWFFDSDCLKFFGIKENPSKVVAAVRLFGNDYELNSRAIALKRDPRDPKTYRNVKTKDVSDLQL